MEVENKKYTIYIVDDDPFIRRSLEIKLRDLQLYNLQSFSSGESCIEALGGDPDLVIMDYNMGDHVMNGMEAMLKIRELRPDVEVAILSGQDEIPVAVEIMNRGAIEYLSKENVLGVNVEKSVEDIIAKKELKDELFRKNEEIKNKNIALEQAQEEILAVNEELNSLNANLDGLVKKRTNALVNTLNKLKDSKEELENFVYRASHDLKGPTARILGLVQVLRMLPDDKDTLNHLEKVCHGLDKIVENFIYVHTIQKSPVTCDRISLQSLQEEVFKRAASIPEARGIDLQYEIVGEDVLYSDHFLLKIILWNLVENAVYFHKNDSQSGRFIHVKLINKGNIVILEVEDNGRGIAENFHKKIFQMFFRAAEHSQGNGLGLYLVSKAVNKLEGQIQFNSVVNAYTHFRIKIPLSFMSARSSN